MVLKFQYDYVHSQMLWFSTNSHYHYKDMATGGLATILNRGHSKKYCTAFLNPWQSGRKCTPVDLY